MEKKCERQFFINYINERLVPTIPGVYESAMSGYHKYLNGGKVESDEKINLIALASGYLATITYLKRNICDEGYGTHNDLWSAFVEMFLLRKSMFFDPMWKKVIDNDEEFSKIIKKTSNPDRAIMALTGFDYKKMLAL